MQKEKHCNSSSATGYSPLATEYYSPAAVQKVCNEDGKCNKELLNIEKKKTKRRSKSFFSSLSVGRNNNNGKECSCPLSYPSHQNIDSRIDADILRCQKFRDILSGPTTDLSELQKISWNGIPPKVRGKTWRILSGYLPASLTRRHTTLERKRAEYGNFLSQYYHTRLDPLNENMFWQICVDIPRTNPMIPFFQEEVVQHIFERILFIWAIRHPASGYVQGINDFVLPFFVVFLEEHIENDAETSNISNISKNILDIVEADTFWCLSKLLDGIQNNYIFAQPGIQTKINVLQNLVSRINEPLHNHIRKYGIDYLHFSFRWMNNLLMRELPLKASIRLWDTYWSEPEGFSLFHIYVCAALLKRFSDDILRLNDFHSVMTFLQNLPCEGFGDDDVSRILSEAYQLKYMFADAPNHLSVNKRES